MEFSDKETKRFNEAKGLSNKLKNLLPKLLFAGDISSISKLPFKVLSLQNVLLYRIVDFSDLAIDLFKSNRLAPAALLTRGAFETTAVLCSLHVKIKEVIEKKDLCDIDKYLMTSLFGGRVKGSPKKSENIMDSIDRASKEFKPYREAYEELCEYAHPNWTGVMGAYSYLDKPNHTLLLGRQHSKVGIMGALPLLLASMALFLNYYDKIKKELPTFNDICEAGKPNQKD